MVAMRIMIGEWKMLIKVLYRKGYLAGDQKMKRTVKVKISGEGSSPHKA